MRENKEVAESLINRKIEQVLQHLPLVRICNPRLTNIGFAIQQN